MKISLIFTLIFTLLAGSYNAPVEDTKTTIPPASIQADAIAANDAAQAEANPKAASEVSVAEAIDASDESVHPAAAPVAVVNAIDASDTESVAPAPQAGAVNAVDVSNESTYPVAAPVAVAEAIDASDTESVAPAPANPVAVANANTASEPPKAEEITAEDAKNIALSHAGLSGKKVHDLEVELDRERGKKIYEVSFESERFDYEYEIDAETGEILISDKEWDD